MDEMQARQAVVEAGNRLVNAALVARTWGNISYRTGAGTFLITPSGLAYGTMGPADLVLYAMEDGSWTGKRKPSSEKGVHEAVYRRFPEAGFVIHTHQTYASALGLAGFAEWSPSPAQEQALGGVALASYGLPGTKTLKRNVAAALAGGAHTVLMAHHGALIAGKDAQEAFARADLLETLCKGAVKGQPETGAEDESALAALAEKIDPAGGYIACTAAPAVAAVSRGKGPHFAQLDDMAQMIGRRIVTLRPDETALGKALLRHDAVLVAGLGAICRGTTAGDARALTMLIEKAAVAWLHTAALGVSSQLSAADALLMRFVYQQKYAKMIGR